MPNSERKDDQPPRPLVDDPEALAAFIDGRADDAARAAAVARLAESSEAADILADAVAALGDSAVDADPGVEQRATAPEPVVHAIDAGVRRQRFGLRSAPLPYVAAALAAGLVAFVAINRSRSSDRNVSSDPGLFASGLIVPSSIADSVLSARPWTEVRGGGAGGVNTAANAGRARAVRIGAYITDVDVVLRSATSSPAHDSAADRALSDLIAALESVPGEATAAQEFRLLRDQPQHRTTGAFAQARGAAALVDPDMVRLGAWAEAARYAAWTRDTAFFAQPATDAVLTGAQQSQRLPAESRLGAREIRHILADRSSIDWGVLRERIRALLGTSGA